MRLVVTEPAEKDLLNIDTKNRQRVRAGINRMLSDLWTSDVRKIKGLSETWRLPVGDWRVIFEFDRQAEVITVLHVRHRREAYR